MLDEFVKVGREELKDEAKMAFVNKRVTKAEDVMLVVRIMLLVEHLQYRDLHHALIEICGLVFDNLDGNDFVCSNILTLDDLAKCTLAENI